MTISYWWKSQISPTPLIQALQKTPTANPTAQTGNNTNQTGNTAKINTLFYDAEIPSSSIEKIGIAGLIIAGIVAYSILK